MMQLSAKSASHHGVHQRKFAAWLGGIAKFSSCNCAICRTWSTSRPAYLAFQTIERLFADPGLPDHLATGTPTYACISTPIICSTLKPSFIGSFPAFAGSVLAED
jgi:hypothetical protein